MDSRADGPARTGSARRRTRVGSRRSAVLGAVVTAAAVLGSLVLAQPAAAADDVPVTVTILTYQEVDCPDDTLVPCPGDYYAKVAIGPHDFVRTPDGPTDRATHSPYWRVTQTVDRSQASSIPVRIELWDDDLDDANPDDMMDVSSGDPDRTIDMTLNLFTGRWTGDAGADGTWSQGANVPRARLLFDISLSSTGDLDGDGIPDAVERFGVRHIENGTVAVETRPYGTVDPAPADPCRKTILLEVDYMSGAADGHTHRPQDAALAEVQQAFADAPVPGVPCPYTQLGFGGSGVQLLVQVDQTLPEQAVYDLDDLTTTRATQFSPAARPYVHYAVFAHDQEAGSSSSGLCCREGKDFIVTLGSWRTTCVVPGPDGTLDTTRAGDDQVVGTTIVNGGNRLCDSTPPANDDLSVGPGCVGPGPNGVRDTTAANDDVQTAASVTWGPDRVCDTTAAGDDTQQLDVGAPRSWHAAGSVRDQSGTLMHELGHALGLAHRGRDDVNHAPNYLSAMSYFFQQGIPRAGAPGSVLDYSRTALPTLDERLLNENNGVGGPSTLLTRWFDPTGAVQSANAGGPIDWDRNGTIGFSTVDLNNDSACVAAGANGTLESTPGGDDAVANGVVHNGSNNVCQTAPAADDMRVFTGQGGTPINGMCVGRGPDGRITSTRAGDDVAFTDQITAGPDQVCQTIAVGDDVQVTPDGSSEPALHPGWDDWSNLRYTGVLAVVGAGQDAGHAHGDIDYSHVRFLESRDALLMDPDLRGTKTVDLAVATPGDRLTYTVTAANTGTGDATVVRFVDTLPDGTVVTRTSPDILAGRSRAETFSYLVPCGTADGTVLTNRATLSARNLQGLLEVDRSNNAASASTTVSAPVLELAKTATSTVGAGEAVTYRLTYENTGGGDASAVVVTDTLPADVYYSPALDIGAGPGPDSVTLNADGTRTLTWRVGAVPAGSGETTLEFTARPTLLSLGGTAYRNAASLTFTDANGCTYPPVTAAASSTITVVPASGDPLTIGYWRTHPGRLTAETLARVQATDQRYDGADGSTPDGRLTVAEVEAALAPAGAPSVVLGQQLLATYVNLAERRINAGTEISSRLASRLGLDDVRDAALYGIDTMTLSPAQNRTRYSNAIDVLDEINRNRSPRYE